MVNAQEWLDRKYPTAESKEGVLRIGPQRNLSKGAEVFLGFADFVSEQDATKHVMNMEGFENYIEDDLNLEGPLSLKGFFDLRELDISNKKITELDISDCLKLRDLKCNNNQLSELDVSKNRELEVISFNYNQLTDINLKELTKIKKIFCSGNKLKSLKFLKSLNPNRILTLCMENNEFPPQNLDCFTHFVNLQRLYVSGNPFYGSLKPLRNLNDLKEIDIADTDIDSGLEYLPECFFNNNVVASNLDRTKDVASNLPPIRNITSSLAPTRDNFARRLICTGKLAEQLESYKIYDPFRNYNLHAWKRDQNLKAKEQAGGLEELITVNAQEWLDRKYPTSRDKKTVRIGPRESPLKRIGYDLIDMFTGNRNRDSYGDPFFSIVNKGLDSIIYRDKYIEDYINLEGPLSLKGFVNLEELEINDKKITELDVSDCLKLRDLECNNNQLRKLDVSNNLQLEVISFDYNQLTDIDLTGLTKIEKIFCSGNKLKSLKFLEGLDPAKILTLRIENNEFPPQDLSCFTHFVNLRGLYVSGNPFYGSLKPLKNLNNLREIGIADTDVDSGLEYLPECFFDKNQSTRKLICTGKLAKQLERYKIDDNPLRNYDWNAWKRDQNLKDEEREYTFECEPRNYNPTLDKFKLLFLP